MPSRTEGFGLTALEALSAGLPVLVSGNSGLGEAFKKVATGSNWIVASEEPKDWAKAISALREKDRDVRLEECEILRVKYGAKYSWQKQCCSLVETMQKISFDSLGLSVECEPVKLKGSHSQTGTLDPANAAKPKEGTKETITTAAVTYDVEETVAFKEVKPGDRELNELAGKIGGKWNNLGLQLGISQNVLNDIATNGKDKPYDMLLHWKNTTPSATPHSDLHHALCHERVGLDNLAKEFCCKETTLNI
ncbi:uncharacterized protein LOC110054212 isoform X2 [Orbicella faveolata]|uniref:uncharacterized protein LOC110054212 isoform X2 n=1 Tax=Orbicella faveolata TaxID=48498 RepID=UPI0009E38F95|nr:uncharacterized protein LOC110054212 isoform X2 [Orbicella faveolata]